MAKVRLDDILRADAVLAGNKKLSAKEPSWFTLQNGRWAASWPVLNEKDVVLGTLNFRIDPKYKDYPSVSFIFEGRSLCRVDLAPPGMVKFNPPWAIGLPAKIEGNHVHPWQHNRDRILATGSWKLQARQQVEHAVKRVPHMLRWFAGHINLSLDGSQYGFDFTAPTNLFGGEGEQ